MDTHAEQEQEFSTTDISSSTFRMLLQHHPLPIWIYDLTTLAFLDTNAAAEEHFGRTRDALLTLTLRDFCRTDDLEQLTQDAATVLSAHQLVSTRQHQLPDGRIMATRITSHKIEYDRHDAALNVGQQSIRCKGAEHSTADAALLLQSSIEGMNDVIIYSLDRNYCYTSFNTLHQKTLKHSYGTSACLGANMLECITNKEDKRKIKISLDRALAGTPQISVREIGHGHRDYYEMRFNPITDDTGQIIGASVFSSNIGDRLAAGRALHESEERFDAFMNASPTLAWVKDESGKYLYMNNAWFKAFGNKWRGRSGLTDFDISVHDIAEKLRKNDLEVQIGGMPLEAVEETMDEAGCRRFWKSIKFPFRGKLGQRLVGGIALEIAKPNTAPPAESAEQPVADEHKNSV
jgi:PAS domain-containing protein